MKTLIFEGAGWSEADSSKASDVGNCRIRATFLNKRGAEIYLEVNGLLPHKWSPEYIKNFKVAGHVQHCFRTLDPDKSSIRRLEGDHFEFCKASLLRFVNSLEIGGDFEAIEVRDDWNGFHVDGRQD